MKKKIVAVVAIVVGLLCVALVALELYSQYALSTVYDDVYGVVESDGSYYTDSRTPEGSLEYFEVSLDTTIVPVKPNGKARSGYTVALLNCDDEDAEWSYVKLEVDDEEGFSVNDLLSEGSVHLLSEDYVYEDTFYSDDAVAEQVDVDVELNVDAVGADTDSSEAYSLLITYSAAVKDLDREGAAYYQEYEDATTGIGFGHAQVVFTEDALEYSTIDVCFY